MPVISCLAAVLATPLRLCGRLFILPQKTGKKLSPHVPPLVFIYLTSLILAFVGVLSVKAPLYGTIRHTVLHVSWWGASWLS